MGLISEAISCVRAIELACGIWLDGESVASPRTALVRWCSSWTDKLYQIYVNGKFAGATVDNSQRQMVVHLPSFGQSAVRIEVFAVAADEADRDFSGETGDFGGDTGRVKISFLRSQQLAVDARADIYSDNGRGQID